jgi:hypothetical protein
MKMLSKSGLERHIVKGPSQAQVEVLWRLRLESMQLKPGVTAEEDFAAFAGFLARQDVTTFIFKKRGAVNDIDIMGFFCLLKTRIDGNYVVALQHLYFRPRFRGSSLLISSFLRGSFESIAGIFLGRKSYWCMTVYPPSYILARQAMGCTPITMKTASPPQKKILDFLGPLAGSYDACLGTCASKTTPRERGRSLYLTEYETLNANWREGISLPTLVPLTFSTVLNLIKMQLKRLMHSRRK